MSSQAGYWEHIAEAWQENHPQALWRVHSDAIYTALFARWLPEHPDQLVLKTDLFDEAWGEGLWPLLASRARAVVGMDLSARTAGAARVCQRPVRATQSDARTLPFADATFDVIVSNSTLDHFASLDDVIASLGELHRTMRPGGKLLLTMDNLANPAIALRNALPDWALRRLSRIVPYYVGATCGPGRLQAILQRAGFDVEAVEAVMHHPSVLAVALARFLQRRGKRETQKRFLALLTALERLSRWPTRFLSGHYVAVRAVKRDG